jgi:hypothetical protein
MVSPLLPLSIGALMSRNEIVDKQDELTGQIVDTVSENYFAKSSDEKTRLKNVDKIYKQLNSQYPTSVVEAFAHAGFLDSGDLGTAMAFIERVKPETIEKLKTMDDKDINLVFQNNNSKILESVGSKENAVASNLNRGQLKNLSELYFQNDFNKAKKEGTFDGARNLLFGGPLIKQEDVAPAILQLEKETDKIKPDVEEPDQALIDAFASIPGGPMIAMGSGSGQDGISDSQFRLRINDSVDIAMASMGLSGTYTRDVNGNIATTKFTDLDGSKFNYANELVNNFFIAPDFDLNQYRAVGSRVANIIKIEDRKIQNNFDSFNKNIGPNVTLTPEIEKERADKKGKELVFNEAGYNLFVQSTLPLLVSFAKSKSLAYREYVIQAFGKGGYRKYFERYLEDLANQIPQ